MISLVLVVVKIKLLSFGDEIEALNHLSARQRSCKLPTASKSEAIQTRTRKARFLRQSAQADIVCVAAISFSTGTLAKTEL